METEEFVWRILGENVLLHIDMLECLRRESADILASDRDGVLLYDREGQAYMMTATRPEVAYRMADSIPETADSITVHQGFCCDYLMARFKLSNKMVCTNVVYPKREPLEIPACPAEILPLTEAYTELVIRHYSTGCVANSAYIQARLQSGTMYGAFLNKELCGFVGTHSEGSIGILEVLPQFRRKGIAMALQATEANAILARGGYPYGQVKEGNKNSLRLQSKLGFVMAGSHTYWLMK